MSTIRIRRLLAYVATGGALAAAALSPAPAANATPLSFIQALNNYGIVVYDTASALTTGYAICDALNDHTGDVVARDIYTSTSYTEVPTLEVAGRWVVASVEQLCSWHDHRGQAVRA